MSKSLTMIAISEYYDIMNVENGTPSAFQVDNLPAVIKDGFDTNPFLGFSNSSNLTQPTETISGKLMANGINSNISIDEDGNVLCYPPNAFVPYWTRIIFRNFDYTVQPTDSSAYKSIVGNTKEINFTGNVRIPQNARVEMGFDMYDPDNPENMIYTTQPADPSQPGGYILATNNIDLPLTTTTGSIKDYENVPVFLKFDEYPSRSKVIFSQCDKTRNPDVSFTFGYPKGSTEPIKLNLSLSANPPIYNKANHQAATPMKHYNNNLKLEDIQNLFKSCYWSIEWQYIPESH